jgi:hypothetical protein
MSTAHSREERRFPNGDKSDPVMNENGSKPKLDRGLLGNFCQLMFSHLPVRFVIDSLNLTPILEAANNPVKINSRPCSMVRSIVWRIELRFCH